MGQQSEGRLSLVCDFELSFWLGHNQTNVFVHFDGRKVNKQSVGNIVVCSCYSKRCSVHVQARYVLDFSGLTIVEKSSSTSFALGDSTMSSFLLASPMRRICLSILDVDLARVLV